MKRAISYFAISATLLLAATQVEAKDHKNNHKQSHKHHSKHLHHVKPVYVVKKSSPCYHYPVYQEPCYPYYYYSRPGVRLVLPGVSLWFR